MQLNVWQNLRTNSPLLGRLILIVAILVGLMPAQIGLGGWSVEHEAKAATFATTSLSAYQPRLISNTLLVQQAILTNSDSSTLAFGITNVLSADGNTALIAGSDTVNHIARAYIFVRSGSTWTQQARLDTGDSSSGGSITVNAGGLSADGSTAVVGASNAFQQGAAYVFVRSGSIWSLQQKLTAADGSVGDNFGRTTLTADGNTALIGASGLNNSSGAAYIFTRVGGGWIQTQKLTASDGAMGDNFGGVVKISGNGSTAFVAAVNKNSSTGAVYAFVNSGGIFSQQQILTANDGAAGDKFGFVGSSSDGNTAAIGAYAKNGDSGVAYVFTRVGTTWSQQAELTASDGAANQEFGFGLALSGDGNTLIAGAGGNNSTFGGSTGNNNPFFRGAAYQFVRNGASWTQKQKLVASDANAGDFFGASVAISTDGNTILSGARSRNSGAGASYVFVNSTAPNYTYYVPFVANNGQGVGGTYTTYISLQNIGTAAANFSVTYNDPSGNVLSTDNNNGAGLPTNSIFTSSLSNQPNQSGTATISSNQPLAVIVALSGTFNGRSLASGFTAVNGNNDAGFTIAAPLAFKHAFGNYSTAFIIQNTATSTAQVSITYYNNNGLQVANQQRYIAGSSSTTVDQTSADANLPASFNGWAVISSLGGQKLAGVVVETNPDTNFLSAVSCVGTTGRQLFVPVIFQNAFGNFNTGLNLVNPNSMTATVTVSYYKNDGTQVHTSHDNIQLTGNSVVSLFHGSLTDFPEFGGGFNGSAIVTSDQAILTGVNQGGSVGGTPLTGTFGTLGAGSSQVSLPTILKKAYGANFSSGVQVVNTSNVPTTYTVTFYNGSTGAQQYTTQLTGPGGAGLAAHSAVNFYSASDPNLSDNFVGTAVVTANAPGASVAAVVNISNAQFFYTYAEAGS